MQQEGIRNQGENVMCVGNKRKLKVLKKKVMLRLSGAMR